MVNQDEFSIDPLTISPNLCYKKCVGGSNENFVSNLVFEGSGVNTWSIHVQCMYLK